MNTALWVAQGLLAFVFVASGSMKSVASKEWLVAHGQRGVSHYGLPFIRFVALSELCGAVGLIAPWATGIARYLTPVAAACLSVLMVGAARAHATLALENRADAGRVLQERGNMLTNGVLLTLCIGVAVGRW